MSKQAIEEANKKVVAAWAANNTGALLPLLSDDVVLMPPNQPVVAGKAAVKAWFEGMLQQFRTSGVDATIDEIAVSGDLAIDRGSYRWTLTPVGGGSDVTMVGGYVVVWRAQADGSWKFAREIWNSSEPLAQ